MVKPLKTVEEHNAGADLERLQKTPGNPSGVACPKCGKELLRFLCSSQTPPEHRNKTFCRGCGHREKLA